MAAGRSVGWQRVIIIAIVGTVASVSADYLGLIDWIARRIGYGN